MKVHSWNGAPNKVLGLKRFISYLIKSLRIIKFVNYHRYLLRRYYIELNGWIPSIYDHDIYGAEEMKMNNFSE